MKKEKVLKVIDNVVLKCEKVIDKIDENKENIGAGIAISSLLFTATKIAGKITKDEDLDNLATSISNVAVAAAVITMSCVGSKKLFGNSTDNSDDEDDVEENL